MRPVSTGLDWFLLRSRAKPLLVAVVVLALGGCGPDLDWQEKWETFDGVEYVHARFPIKMSTCGFNEEDKRIIQDAAKAWNDLAKERLFETVINCEAELQVNALPEDDRGGVNGASNPWPCGDSLCPGGFISLYRGWWDIPTRWEREVVVRHELGHHLGLGHGFFGTCTMHEVTNYATGFCRAEEMVFCEHYPSLLGCR